MNGKLLTLIISLIGLVISIAILVVMTLKGQIDTSIGRAVSCIVAGGICGAVALVIFLNGKVE